MTAYAQKNYLAPLGKNSTFRIDLYGCFLTSFSNLISGFGTDVDPLAMNAKLAGVGAFLNIGDKNPDGSVAYDGLGWGSITRLYPNIVTTSINYSAGGGWPQSNNAIVKFEFRGITHFCKVADYTKQLILDSYDGQVKNTGYYGKPVQWAIYTNTDSAVAITPMTNVQAATGPVHVGEDLLLPSTITSWRVYKAGGPWTANPDKSIGKLRPDVYGDNNNSSGEKGLSYQITDNPASNIYRITTKSYGAVDIYAGSDTPAKFLPHYTGPAPTQADNTSQVVPVTVEPSQTIKSASPPMTDVTPQAPDTSWQTINKARAGKYTSRVNQDVHDVVSHARIGQQLLEGQNITVAGTYTKDGVEYVVTPTAEASKLFYDIQLNDLKLIALDTPLADDDDSIFNDLKLDETIGDLKELADRVVDTLEQNKSLREKIVEWVAKHIYKINNK